MLSYVTIGALDGEKSVAFYDATLGALGYRRAFFDNGWAGYGQTEDKQTVFVCPPFDGQTARAGNGIMVAFAADSREQVAAAHAAALANGGLRRGRARLPPARRRRLLRRLRARPDRQQAGRRVHQELRRSYTAPCATAFSLA